MPLDMDALKNATGGTEPPDGTHDALLEKVAILDTKNGMRLKTQWSAGDREFWWQSWLALDGGTPGTRSRPARS